ncbi:hypothetical protein SAMN05444271_15612, partial [Halohasta litchfieldiae]
FVSLLRSPTTNAETIQEAPSSRYENYSMTPSCVAIFIELNHIEIRVFVGFSNSIHIV